MCKKLVLVLVLGLLTGVASADVWKIDFQGDRWYVEEGENDMTEPGVHWNIFEVTHATTGPEPVPHMTAPIELPLVNTDGEATEAMFVLNSDSFGQSRHGDAKDQLQGDWIYVKDTWRGVATEPCNWAILGLEPDAQYELIYYHGIDMPDHGIWFNANGVETLIEGVGGEATALVTTDGLGTITGVALARDLGYWSGNWAGLVIVPEPATIALFGLGGLALIRRRRA